MHVEQAIVVDLTGASWYSVLSPTMVCRSQGHLWENAMCDHRPHHRGGVVSACRF